MRKQIASVGNKTRFLIAGLLLPFSLGAVAANDVDFNNDGIADVLWRNELTKEMRSWTMNGNNLYSAINHFPAFAVGDNNWQVVGLGDMNGDAITDIVFRDVVNGYNRAWLMDASRPAPTYVAAGAQASGANAITVGLPAGLQTNDLLIVFIETAAQATSISANGDAVSAWTEVMTAQSVGTAAAADATRLTAYWGIYDGAATTGPTIADSGDHQLAVMIAVRGADTTTPFNITAGATEATADTSGSIPGATTTVDDTLVIAAIATALPDSNSTAEFASWSNGDLTSVTEAVDQTRNAGNGGGLGIARGGKLVAGAYANTSVTTAASAFKAMMSMAVQPPQSVPAAVSRAAIAFYPQFGNGDWSLIGVGDSNSDATEDLFFHNSVDGTLRIWEMDANGNRETVCFIPNKLIGYQAQAVADFDGDGDADIFWRKTDVGTHRVWLMQNCAIDSIVYPPNQTILTMNVVGSGDFDNDGTDDLLWVDTDGNSQIIWRMLSGTYSSTSILSTPTTGNYYSGIGDYDNDGTDDILVYNQNTGGARIRWINNLTLESTVGLPIFGAGGDWDIIVDKDN